MAMDAHEIERMIKAALPDAAIEIKDLAGDGDHVAGPVFEPRGRGLGGLAQVDGRGAERRREGGAQGRGIRNGKGDQERAHG